MKKLIDSQQWQVEAKMVARLAWIMWSVAMIAQLLNNLHRVAGSVALDRIMADFGMSATMAGGVMAMLFYVYAAMQFPSGIFADYLGPRKTVALGCLVAAVGSFIFGLAPSPPILYLGRFLLSLGTSVIFVSVLKIQTRWFSSRYFAKVTALTGAAGPIGSLIGTTPMALLVTLAGWRLSYELVGVLGLVICLVCWLVIRDSPQEKGLPSLVEMKEREAGSTAPILQSDTVTQGFLKRLNTIFTNKHVWPPFLIGAGSYGTILVLQGAWGIPYLMQVYYMTRDTAANFMLLTLIGFMSGTFVIAFVSDRLQRRKLPLIVCSLVYLFLWVMMTLWNGGRPPVTTLYPILFFLGFFSGTGMLHFTCAKEVVPPLVSGMTLGLVNMGIFLAPAILQIVFGQMLDLGWEGALLNEARLYPLAAFQSGFVFVCAATLPYVFGALLLKETKCRDIYK